MYNGQYITFFI